jgi:MoaA/NifB/PqqE/SkfB family radical SAM enzyme
MNSGPERKGRLTFAQMRGLIDEIASVTQIRTIIFAGDEPLLLGPDIFAAISHARSGRLGTRLVTNAVGSKYQ